MNPIISDFNRYPNLLVYSYNLNKKCLFNFFLNFLYFDYLKKVNFFYKNKKNLPFLNNQSTKNFTSKLTKKTKINEKLFLKLINFSYFYNIYTKLNSDNIFYCTVINIYVKNKLNFYFLFFKSKLNSLKLHRNIIYNSENIFDYFLNLKKLAKKKNLKFTFFYSHIFELFLNWNNLNLNFKINWKQSKTIKYLFLKKFIKTFRLNANFILTYLVFFNDFFNFKKNSTFFSNKYLINYYSFFDFNKNIYDDSEINFKNQKANIYFFNNYYPILTLAQKNKTYNSFSKFFKKIHNSNHVNFTIKLFISFFECLLSKNIFIKVDNNYFNKINNRNFFFFSNNYKNYQPTYFKNYLLSDLLEIIWYSFFLKDLSMLSEWITKFMESLNFKNHKKFIMFFQNLFLKNSGLLIDSLKIKGFLFDIRGKVGVTGSSKKRHICFKIGSLKKSSKKCKIDFNQNLVRTYSGVMGLTYIIAY